MLVNIFSHFSGEWETSLDNNDETYHRNLCLSVVRSPHYIFNQIIVDYSNLTFDLQQSEYITSEMTLVTYNEQDVRMLHCLQGNKGFYLTKYSKYEGFILFTNTPSGMKPRGVVTVFYQVNETYAHFNNAIQSLKYRCRGK